MKEKMIAKMIILKVSTTLCVTRHYLHSSISAFEHYTKLLISKLSNVSSDDPLLFNCKYNITGNWGLSSLEDDIFDKNELGTFSFGVKIIFIILSIRYGNIFYLVIDCMARMKLEDVL